jgi:hypothetical protein
MSVEVLPGLPAPPLGEAFALALYGPARIEPHVVRARVVRDDGSGVLGLRFEDENEERSGELSKLVAALPAEVPLIEPLARERAASGPTLLGEILPANSAT